MSTAPTTEQNRELLRRIDRVKQAVDGLDIWGTLHDAAVAVQQMDNEREDVRHALTSQQAELHAKTLLQITKAVVHLNSSKKLAACGDYRMHAEAEKARLILNDLLGVA